MASATTDYGRTDHLPYQNAGSMYLIKLIGTILLSAIIAAILFYIIPVLF